MIRSASHSSYPIGDGEPRDETTEAIVVAEQSRAFLDVVTDGQVRWKDGPIARVAACLDGVEMEGDRPVLVGEVRRREAIAVAGYRAASLVTPKPVKVSLPGPATFVRLAGAPERTLQQVAAAMAEEVRELGEAGCRFFQLDEPLLSGRPGEVAACAAVLAAAPAGSITILCPPASMDGLADLPGTHLGLDVADGVALPRLASLPPGRGVFLGLFDAGHASLEDAEEVASCLAPWRAHLEGRDVLVGPNGGLAALPRDLAFEKLLQARYLAELLRRRWTLSESRR